MSRRLLVLDVVGLVPDLLGPRLAALGRSGWQRSLRPVFPAVTCTAQASMLTGRLPDGHGIVGNGWYFHDLSEVLFWRQSARLVQGPKVWETLRRARPGLRVAQLFWWFNMYSGVDLSVTPRPEYPADGRKVPGVYTHPQDLRARLEQRLGPFPLFRFWGPAADLVSTRWIADCALDVLERDRPDLCLVYLPHLDYVLQRSGPGTAVAKEHAAAQVDEQAGRLLDAAAAADMDVLVVSEYGIGPVSRVVYPNRVLREAGLLAALWQDSVGETLDAGASRAFAVCDHQVAHVYVADPADVPAVARLLGAQPGVARVLAGEARRAAGLDHPRAGQVVLEAAPEAWFAYNYWLDDARAPDFARTVDIHRKPGYDPAELFLDPALRWPKLRIARRLLGRKLGFRNLLDVIPLDPSPVAGSHGHVPASAALWPLALGGPGVPEPRGDDLRAVHDVILRALGGAELISAPQRLALCGDDLPRAAAAVRRAGLTVVRRDPEVVLCHGGDGTLLRAEREWPGVPKLPVRVATRARPCPEHGLDAVLARLARGQLPREELPLLECVVGHLHLTAVNDVVLRNESPATAVRLRVRVDGKDSAEVTGDGIVCATPFGSSGYYRSITRATFDVGLGLAFNNSTEPRAPLVLDAGQPVEVELLRGPAVLVHDNDPRSVFLREGQRFRVSLSKQTAVVLGLDSLRCQLCRKPDGSVFNPH